MLRQRGFDPRDEIEAVGLVVGMLELTSPAFGKMPARRLLVVRAGGERSVVEKSIARNPERHVAAA
jgi:hypothetical protein